MLSYKKNLWPLFIHGVQLLHGRVPQLACTTYVHTSNFINKHMNLDMCMLTLPLIFSLWFFKVFEILLVRTILYCLTTYCYIFSNIIVGVIYRHPSMDLTDFNCNYLQTIRKYLQRTKIYFPNWRMLIYWIIMSIIRQMNF